MWNKSFPNEEKKERTSETEKAQLSEKSGKSNTTGLPRTAEKDWQLFYSVQIERYLKRKVQKRFCSEVEKDVIKDIISEYWRCLKIKIPENSSKKAKIDLFYRFVLIFPYFVVEEETIIPVNFCKKTIIREEEACSCGSGIPYYDCCGRIPDAEELINGSF